eukprot:3074199-Rhodomonas_salina.1
MNSRGPTVSLSLTRTRTQARSLLRVKPGSASGSAAEAGEHRDDYNVPVDVTRSIRLGSQPQ